MTKKHFEMAAKQLSNLQESEPVRRVVAEQFAELFQGFNGQFDYERFMAACGLEEEGV